MGYIVNAVCEKFGHAAAAGIPFAMGSFRWPAPYYRGGRLGPNNSFKPQPLCGSAQFSLRWRMEESGEFEQIGRLIARFFSAFDNRHGVKPTLGAILGCFAEKAVIARSGDSDIQLFTPIEFAMPRLELLESGTLLDFHEAEDSSSTSVLGNLAVRTSRYHKAGVLQGTPFVGAGTKYFQLVALDSGWRILSLAWADDET